MFISPMNGVGTIGSITESNLVNSNSNNVLPFKDMFQSAIQNVVQTGEKAAYNEYLLSTGQTQDLHTLTIDSTSAQLSLDLLIQLRNKAMDAYNELMRINL